MAVRVAGAGFAATVKPIVPDPVPLEGDNVTQFAPLVADHPQPTGVVTFTDPLPPAAPTLCDALSSVKVHAAPACVTVNV